MSEENKVVSLAGARDKDKEKEKDKQTQASNNNTAENATYCTFCGRPNYLVLKMIKGPGVNICSECVMICVQYLVLEDKMPADEVKKILDAFWKGSKQ